MKIASWILTILSYVAGVTLLLVQIFAHVADLFFNGLLPVLLVGFVGHILLCVMKRRGEKLGKDGLAVYILSFPQFIVIAIILLIFLLLFKLADFICYMIEGKHPFGTFCDNGFGLLLGKPRAGTYSDDDDEGKEYLEVIDDYGNHLKLEFVEMTEDYDPDSPYAYQYYKRYRDNLGNYWRNYEDNKVIEEKKVERAATNKKIGVN